MKLAAVQCGKLDPERQKAPRMPVRAAHRDTKRVRGISHPPESVGGFHLGMVLVGSVVACSVNLLLNKQNGFSLTLALALALAVTL